MAGTYRKIMHKPANMTYKLMRYDDPNFPLAMTDEDRIFKRTLPDPPTEGQHLALQLDLTLGSSTYATMAIREILKEETSADHQKGLTMAMLAKNEGEVDTEMKEITADAPAVEPAVE